MKILASVLISTLVFLVHLTASAQVTRLTPDSSNSTTRATNILVLAVVPTTQEIANIAYGAVAPYIPSTGTIAGIAYSTVVPLIPNQGSFCGYGTRYFYPDNGSETWVTNIACNGASQLGYPFACPGGYAFLKLGELGNGGGTAANSVSAYSCVKS